MYPEGDDGKERIFAFADVIGQVSHVGSAEREADTEF